LFIFFFIILSNKTAMSYEKTNEKGSQFDFLGDNSLFDTGK